MRLPFPVLVALWFLLGCGASSPVPPATVLHVASCQVVIHREIAAHADCPSAELAINSDPGCSLLYPNGLKLDCPEFRK